MKDLAYINIIGTIYDNSIDHTVVETDQLYDKKLDKKQEDINEEFRRDIDRALSNTQSEDPIYSQLTLGGKFPLFLMGGSSKQNNDEPETIPEEINEAIATIQEQIESLQNTINNINIPEYHESIHHVFLTQEEYNALEEYDNDTLYFITQSVGLGTFPIILSEDGTIHDITDNNGFIGIFPITLT